MRSSRLYFASRSPPVTEPTLICPPSVPTARSASASSSVSPDRAEMTVRSPASLARATTSSVSVIVPIWFILTSTALAEASAIPRSTRPRFVVNRSSPTTCSRSPSRAVNAAHAGQSSSASGSSTETTGCSAASSAT
jgi:hypothetical protein